MLSDIGLTRSSRIGQTVHPMTLGYVRAPDRVGVFRAERRPSVMANGVTKESRGPDADEILEMNWSALAGYSSHQPERRRHHFGILNWPVHESSGVQPVTM